MDIVDIFRKNAERRRQELGLTQDGLAKKIGTSRSAVTRSLYGQVAPTIDTVQKWAEALETTAAELLTDTSIETHEESPSELRLRLFRAILDADSDSLAACLHVFGPGVEADNIHRSPRRK